MDGDVAGRALARAIASFFRGLTDEDIAALASGDARIVVEYRRAPRRKTPSRRVAVDVNYVHEELSRASSREEARAVLEELSPLREQLKQVAKHLDLPTPKSDTVDRLRDRIVDGTVGFRLRSDAIRSADPIDPPRSK